MKMFLLLSIVLMTSLSGCVQPLNLKADAASVQQAKAFAPKAGMSNLYVYRKPGFMQGDSPIEIQVDDIAVGTLQNDKFIYLEIPPGNHTVYAKAIGTFGYAEAKIDVDTHANENVFQQPVISHSSPFSIQHVNEAVGKKAVEECELIPISKNTLSLFSKQNKSASSGIIKSNKAPMERLVLMPLRVGDESRNLQGAMETALVQGLQQNYIVLSGEQVAQKAREIFLKESRNTAKKECDETRCMQNIAEAFQAELIATANVTKQDGGYFLALSIQNIFDNKVVYSNSMPCKNCDSFQVVEKLKELSQ